MTGDHHRRRQARPATAVAGEEEDPIPSFIDWDLDTMPLDDLVDDLGEGLLPLKDADLLVIDDETVAMLDYLARAPVDELLHPRARPACKRG